MSKLFAFNFAEILCAMIDLRKPAKQADQREERFLQKDCAMWLKKELYLRGLPQIFYHVANERKATPAQHSRLKLQGVLKGVSDIVLPVRSQEFSGIYAELKTKNGVPSPEQKAFLKGVAEQGYLAVIINDIITFREVLTSYLNNRQTNNE